MARSPLTLAATVTSALPRVGVVNVGMLNDGDDDRYDSAIAELDDGRRVLVRASANTAAAVALTAQARALRALTPGVRAILPFAAPQLLGEADLDAGRAVVLDYLAGYRVDAAHVPAGRGVATALGAAIAAVHALPATVVRSEGLTALSPQQSRDEVVRLVDRTAQTRRAPVALIARWRQLLAASHLWRFESSVILNGVDAVDFLFSDGPKGPEIVALLEWSGLAVGDPALDLRWTSSAPAAAADVFESYTEAMHRAPDEGLRARARMYAELEFAKWLLHGIDEDDEEVVSDAVALLTTLSDSVRADGLVPEPDLGVDEALALLDRVVAVVPAPVDTSMQTDAYDAEMLSEYLETDSGREEQHRVTAPEARTSEAPAAAAEPEARVPHIDARPEAWASRPLTAAPPAPAPERVPAPEAGPAEAGALPHAVTQPIPVIEPAGPAPTQDTGAHIHSVEDEIDPVADQADAERATRAALHRWARSDSE